MFGNNDQKDETKGVVGSPAATDTGAPLPPADSSTDNASNDNASADMSVASAPATNGSVIGDPTPPADTPLVSGGPASTSDDKQTDASANVSADDPATTDDLLGIKQTALQQLSPLVGHLDQTPEEKFRTTMMMIQASDDQSLVKTAFEAAKDISDDKARAQALLDVINEINYFTQKDSN